LTLLLFKNVTYVKTFWWGNAQMWYSSPDNNMGSTQIILTELMKALL